jgi:hypothetical protein
MAKVQLHYIYNEPGFIKVHSVPELLGNEFQFKNFAAMNFTARILYYY